MSSKKTIIIAVCITAVVSSSLTSIARNIAESSHGYSKLISKIETIAHLSDKYFLNDIDYQKMEDYAAYAMTAALNDPYTQYFDADTFKTYTDDNKGIFVGVGIVVAPNKENNTVEVVAPYEDSPAEKAGILSGDVVVSMDGNSCDASNYSDVIDMLKGNAGESMTLKIKRGDSEPFDVTITREEIHRIAVKSKMLENNIGYIRISDFDIGIAKDFKNQFAQLKENGMQKLIIDLRNNPGGDADAVCSIADYMLPSGTIMYTMDKNGNKVYTKSSDTITDADGREITDKFSLNVPIAVLVNKGSASASEVLSGSLQCAGRATVIGVTTYGKGVIQSIIPFKDGSGIKITYGKYYFANDKCIQGEGVTPDIVSELPDGINKNIAQLTEQEDTQLKAAVNFLNNN